MWSIVLTLAMLSALSVAEISTTTCLDGDGQAIQISSTWISKDKQYQMTCLEDKEKGAVNRQTSCLTKKGQTILPRNVMEEENELYECKTTDTGEVSLVIIPHSPAISVEPKEKKKNRECVSYKWTGSSYAIGKAQCEDGSYCASQVQIRDGIRIVVNHFVDYCETEKNLETLGSESKLTWSGTSDNGADIKGCYQYANMPNMYLCFCNWDNCNEEQNLKAVFSEYQAGFGESHPPVHLPKPTATTNKSKENHCKYDGEYYPIGECWKSNGPKIYQMACEPHKTKGAISRKKWCWTPKFTPIIPGKYEIEDDKVYFCKKQKNGNIKVHITPVVVNGSCVDRDGNKMKPGDTWLEREADGSGYEWKCNEEGTKHKIFCITAYGFEMPEGTENFLEGNKIYTCIKDPKQDGLVLVIIQKDQELPKKQNVRKSMLVLR